MRQRLALNLQQEPYIGGDYTMAKLMNVQITYFNKKLVKLFPNEYIIQPHDLWNL